MSLAKHAERELKLAGLFEKDSDYGGAIAEAVMTLIRAFSAQGHSGFSAPYAADIFSRLARYECLTPLTGTTDEWNDDISDTFFQNNRVGSVFKEKDNDKSYYLDAIVWVDERGVSFTGSVEKIKSAQYIKSFPFSPKTFFVEVTTDGNGEHRIKDKSQLAPVFEYYEMPENCAREERI